MPNTYTNLLFHIVYSTKYRKPLIDAKWQDDLYAYMGGIIREEKGILLCAGGMADHVHLLAKLPPTIAVSDMLRLIKTNSSKWLGERDDVRYFEWQEGYAAFSVSESQADRVREYVLHQEEHHRRGSSRRSTWDCCASIRSRLTSVTFSRRSTLGRDDGNHHRRLSPLPGACRAMGSRPGAHAPGYILSSLRDWERVERSRPLFLFRSGKTKRRPDDCADPQDRAGNARLGGHLRRRRVRRLRRGHRGPGDPDAALDRTGSFPDGLAGRRTGTLE